MNPNTLVATLRHDVKLEAKACRENILRGLAGFTGVGDTVERLKSDAPLAKETGTSDIRTRRTGEAAETILSPPFLVFWRYNSTPVGPQKRKWPLPKQSSYISHTSAQKKGSTGRTRNFQARQKRGPSRQVQVWLPLSRVRDGVQKDFSMSKKPRVKSRKCARECLHPRGRQEGSGRPRSQRVYNSGTSAGTSRRTQPARPLYDDVALL